MYDGVRRPVAVSRTVLVTAAILLVALVVTGGLLWYTNTSMIHALDAGRPLAATPGDSVAIELPLEECTGSVVTFQRKGLFGRWQQTHVGQEREIVPWYHIGTRTLDSTLECSTSMTLTIPADVTWSPVAACSIDMDCFVIDVDHGD
jgi:hypothetical protein